MTAEPKRDRVSYDSLIRAAAGIFRAQGYGSSTTRQLATELGIQRSSLYHHIAGKEQLLHSICLLSLANIGKEVRAAVDAAAPDERFRALTDAHVTTALGDMDLHSVMLVELRSLSPDLRAEVVLERTRYEQFIEHVIGEEQAAGRLRTDIAPRMLTLSLLNLLNWSIFWYHPGGEVAAEDLASLFWSVFVDGVGHPGQPRDLRP